MNTLNHFKTLREIKRVRLKSALESGRYLDLMLDNFNVEDLNIEEIEEKYNLKLLDKPGARGYRARVFLLAPEEVKESLRYNDDGEPLTWMCILANYLEYDIEEVVDVYLGLREMD